MFIQAERSVQITCLGCEKLKFLIFRNGNLPILLYGRDFYNFVKFQYLDASNNRRRVNLHFYSPFASSASSARVFNQIRFLLVCRFSVEAEMAPISHLLVYYTTPLGEIVGDSISFGVKLQHEKVSKKNWNFPFLFILAFIVEKYTQSYA